MNQGSVGWCVDGKDFTSSSECSWRLSLRVPGFCIPKSHIVAFAPHSLAINIWWEQVHQKTLSWVFLCWIKPLRMQLSREIWGREKIRRNQSFLFQKMFYYPHIHLVSLDGFTLNAYNSLSLIHHKRFALSHRESQIWFYIFLYTIFSPSFCFPCCQYVSTINLKTSSTPLYISLEIDTI